MNLVIEKDLAFHLGTVDKEPVQRGLVIHYRVSKILQP